MKTRSNPLKQIFCFVILLAICLTACTSQATTVAPVEETEAPAVVAPTEAPVQATEEPAAATEEPAAATEEPAAATEAPAAEVSTEAVMAELAEKVKSESGVINTYGMPETWANYGSTFAKFKELYGVTQQDIDMGGPTILTRMTEENASKNDFADISMTFGYKVAQAGLSADYKVSCWDALPEGFKGQEKDGSVWNAAYKGTLGWIVNTSIVTKVPLTWQDLKDPSLKGLVSYMDPQTTATGLSTVLAASYATSGDAYNYQSGIDFLAELHKAGIIASVDPKTDISKFQRGEVGVLINFDYNLLAWKDQLGIPAEVVIPTDGSISTAYGLQIARNAPNPNTARLALEYLLCGEGQQLYANAYVSPINPTIEIPADVAAKFPPAEMYKNVVMNDFLKEGEISDALKAAWSAATGIK
jgi:putative spermidine/putrescine transport system substrate-binding protein